MLCTDKHHVSCIETVHFVFFRSVLQDGNPGAIQYLELVCRGSGHLPDNSFARQAHDLSGKQVYQTLVCRQGVSVREMLDDVMICQFGRA